MKRIATVLALLAASSVPVAAGGDWDDDYYESHHWRSDTRATYGQHPYRAPAYEVYIPYGAYFADEHGYYGANCEIEREWGRGRYREKIECDDDD